MFISRVTAKRLAFVSAAALALLQAACAAINQQDSLSPPVTLSALDVDRESAIVSAEPSLVDRDPADGRPDWPILTITLTGRETEHRPTYAHNLSPKHDSPRRRSEFPDARSALDVEPQPCRDQAVHAVLSAGWGFLQLPLAPVDMIINSRWPWSVERSPATEYVRIRD